MSPITGSCVSSLIAMTSLTPFARMATAPPSLAALAIFLMISAPCKGSFSNAWQLTMSLPLI